MSHATTIPEVRDPVVYYDKVSTVFEGHAVDATLEMKARITHVDTADHPFSFVSLVAWDSLNHELVWHDSVPYNNGELGTWYWPP